MQVYLLNKLLLNNAARTMYIICMYVCKSAGVYLRNQPIIQSIIFLCMVTKLITKLNSGVVVVVSGIELLCYSR